VLPALINNSFIEIQITINGEIKSISSGLFLKDEFIKHESIFSLCPFLIGTLEAVNQKSVLIECMFIVLPKNEYAVDVNLLKNDEDIVVTILNRSLNYENVDKLNQARNDLFFLKRELGEKNKELEKLRLIAEKANEEKTRFLAMMSHEVRNPLNVILGYAEILKNEITANHVEKYINNLQFAGNNLKTIVDDILDLSKVESGKLELVQQPISLEKVLDQIENNYKESLLIDSVDLVFNCSNKVPELVEGDDVRIYQIITNIINNAIKFTKEGSVTTKIELVENKGENALLVFSISDTGRGMTEEQTKTIFEEYSQNEASDNRISKGAGLGLAIVKRLVEAMNGDIKVTSQLNVGTTFSIEIPFKIVSNMEQNNEEQSNENLIKDKRILIADDSQLNRTIVAHVLRQNEAQIFEAIDGNDAYEQLKETSFDLVLLDINMPKLSGEQIIKAKADYEKLNKETPILAFTGSYGKEEVENYFKIGFKDVIPKPFTQEDLIAILNRVISGN